jgi:hypothetical protein
MPWRKETWGNHEFQRWLFLSVVISCALGVAVLFVLILKDRNHISAQNREIQQQRYDAAFHNCLDQNKRHDDTLRTLRQEIAALTDGQKIRAERSEKFTEILIDSLVPHRNCIKVANTVLHPPTVQQTKKGQ